MKIDKGNYELTDDELIYLNRSVKTISKMEICEKMHISLYQLRRIMAKYFPSIARNQRNIVTLQDEKYIVENFPHISNSEIYNHLGISRSALLRIVAKHDLHKTEEFLESQKSIRSRRNKLIVAGKPLAPCSGRFCERRESCMHYKSYISANKPKCGLLHNGMSTMCINNLSFTDYVECE